MGRLNCELQCKQRLDRRKWRQRRRSWQLLVGWRPTIEGSLPNPLLQDGEVEEVVEFPDVEVRYIRFQVLTFWALGGGLQYIRPFYI